MVILFVLITKNNKQLNMRFCGEIASLRKFNRIESELLKRFIFSRSQI